MAPAQVLLGLGMGTAFTAGMNLATLGVCADDAGVASAKLNTSQQVGGAIGTALLNTVAATATAGWLAANAGVDPAAAAVHGYTTAFTWAAGLLVLAAGVVAVCVNARPQNESATAGLDAADAAAPISIH